jgi:RNA polymerase-binding protein DksA
VAKSSKKAAPKSAGKSTTKAKSVASKVTTKAAGGGKPSGGKTAAKAPAASVARKAAAADKPLPRITMPPKAKSALTKTDHRDRAVEGVRPSNGKSPARTLPRVTPPPAAPGSIGAKRAKSRFEPEPAVIMPKPKPGKNAAGLSARELEHFRELLLAKRRELVGDMYSMEREALQRSGENLSNLPIHMADMGTDNYEQEFTLGLMEKDRQLLREINSALMKIQNGMYGICEGTGKPISKARLEVQPWAKFSIEHARKLEDRKFVRF